MLFKKILSSMMATVVAFVAINTAMPTKIVNAATFDNLNQNEIVAEMGAGWNLGNQLEANIGGVPDETCWGNPTIDESLIKAVKNAGFKTIRIPVSYLSKIGNDSNYTIDTAWLNRVQEVVDMCIENDLYVIINIHGDGYNSVEGGWLLCNGSDQATIRAKYKACWNQIAARFSSYDEHLIFESMNEEFDGTYGTPNQTYYSNINALNQIFVDTVRQSGGNNSMRWLLIPGWNTNIEYTAGDYGFVMPTDNYISTTIPSNENRIMVSVHYYDPWEFCGEESSSITQWGSSATNSSKVASHGNESYMISQFNMLYSKFVSQGYPVIIGEYGAIDKASYDSTNTTCRADFAEKVCTYSKKYGCVPVWWDNGVNNTYGFALFDRNTKTVTQQKIIDAIMTACNSSSTNAPTTTTETVLFSNGSSDQSYSTSDATWLINASDDSIITLKYKCSDSSHSNWGILGWGATVDGDWVNGSTYNAGSTATDEVTVSLTAKQLKDSLSITSTSNVGYLALNAYNGGQIVSLSIKDSTSSTPTTQQTTTTKATTTTTTTKATTTTETTTETTTKTTTTTTTSTTEATTTASKNLELNANNLTIGTYKTAFSSGDFTVGASSSKNVSVEKANITINNTYFSKALKMNGGGNSTGRYISFKATGACKVYVTACSTSTKATRTIRLDSSKVGGTKIGTNTVNGTASTISYDIKTAGTYYLYSTSSGIRVYDVKVVY